MEKCDKCKINPATYILCCSKSEQYTHIHRYDKGFIQGMKDVQILCDDCLILEGGKRIMIDKLKGENCIICFNLYLQILNKNEPLEKIK